MIQLSQSKKSFEKLFINFVSNFNGHLHLYSIDNAVNKKIKKKVASEKGEERLRQHEVRSSQTSASSYPRCNCPAARNGIVQRTVKITAFEKTTTIAQDGSEKRLKMDRAQRKLAKIDLHFKENEVNALNK